MESAAHRALSRYHGYEDASPVALGDGLINETFLVTDRSGERSVLQRVNPIFDPLIHHNIAAVTGRLEEAGLTTPRLVETKEGRPFVEIEDGGVTTIFRLLTYVDGTSFNTVENVAQATSAGELVGRFHAALEGLDHVFVGTRVGVHDTAAHLERLRSAVEKHSDHRLAEVVLPLGEAILERAEKLDPLPALEEQPCHGDLKINNILFSGPSPPARDQALCLIDLDTLGPMHLAYELGDAWRSWCNPAGEDVTSAQFDLAIFEASLTGYRKGRGRDLRDAESSALFLGVEWVTVELAARFAADALLETYFGWDRSRYPGAGEHNLVRAQGQLALHRAVMGTRSERARILGI